MAFMKKLGGALKAPLKGMAGVGGMMGQKPAQPSMGGMKSRVGIGPSPNAGMLGGMAAIGNRFGGMQKPQAPPMMPPPQMDQMQLPSGPPQTMMPPPDMGGGMMPLPQGPPQMGGPPQPMMNRKQSMFARQPNRPMY